MLEFPHRLKLKLSLLPVLSVKNRIGDLCCRFLALICLSQPRSFIQWRCCTITTKYILLDYHQSSWGLCLCMDRNCALRLPRILKLSSTVFLPVKIQMRNSPGRINSKKVSSWRRTQQSKVLITCSLVVVVRCEVGWTKPEWLAISKEGWSVIYISSNLCL